MTLLRRAMVLPDPQLSTRRALGVDDFATHRADLLHGADLRRHRVVDVLPTRGSIPVGRVVGQVLAPGDRPASGLAAQHRASLRTCGHLAGHSPGEPSPAQSAGPPQASSEAAVRCTMHAHHPPASRTDRRERARHLPDGPRLHCHPARRTAAGAAPAADRQASHRLAHPTPLNSERRRARRVEGPLLARCLELDTAAERVCGFGELLAHRLGPTLPAAHGSTPSMPASCPACRTSPCPVRCPCFSDPPRPHLQAVRVSTRCPMPLVGRPARPWGSRPMHGPRSAAALPTPPRRAPACTRCSTRTAGGAPRMLAPRPPRPLCPTTRLMPTQRAPPPRRRTAWPACATRTVGPSGARATSHRAGVSTPTASAWAAVIGRSSGRA